LQAVREKGAVIEAAATTVLGSPSACVLVEPTGDVNVIATMERMFHPAYTTVGHVFPQVSVTHSALADAATAIGATLASIGFTGTGAHVNIPFPLVYGVLCFLLSDVCSASVWSSACHFMLRSALPSIFSTLHLTHLLQNSCRKQ
jgi:hypothetical protein